MSELPEVEELRTSSEASVLVDNLRDLLGAMFSDPGLVQLRQRDPTHPAVERFAALDELGSGDNRLPDHVGVAIEPLRMCLDTMTWAPGAPVREFWECLPDEATRRRTVSVLADPEQFHDVLAELSFWGWLKNQGFKAERVEEEGLSDIVIERGASQEIRAEVKRIRSTDPRRIAQVIQKANSQIKKSAPPGGGIVFISLNVPIRRGRPDDVLPSEVQSYVDEAFRATRTDNSSVSQIVVTWEDFVTRGDWPDPITVYVRRRVVGFQHARPRVRLAIDPERFSVQPFAATQLSSPDEDIYQTPEQLLLALRAVTSEETLGTYPVRLSGHLKSDAGAKLAIRESHVRDAFECPDAFVIHAVGGGPTAIVTKRITTKSTDFLLVLHASRTDGKPEWLVKGGYRLYDTADTLDQLQRDPNEAFAALLQRYGNRFSVGGVGKAWWVPEFRLQLPNASPMSLQEKIEKAILSACGVGRTAGEAFAFLAVKLEGPRQAVVAGLHWIDPDRYRAAAIRASRTPR